MRQRVAEALRSYTGRVERYYLRRGDDYSCFGIMCKVYMDVVCNNGVYEFNGQSHKLPRCVEKELNFRYSPPLLRKSFDEVARILEREIVHEGMKYVIEECYENGVYFIGNSESFVDLWSDT